MKPIVLGIGIAMLLSTSPAGAAEPLKVYILAGQSNMEGAGRIAADPNRNEGRGSLEYVAKRAPEGSLLSKLLAEDGSWRERDDVSIWYLGRMGKLAPGFGARPETIGPELGFGLVMGEASEEPVLLFKMAWGGKSLAKDFRPPSSGGEVGPYYTQLVDETKKMLADVKSYFPEYAGREVKLAGFGWHQGWNDRINQSFNDAYEENMANFIRDIRKDLGAPNLPFVIAETGMNGPGETHPRALSLMKAQAAVAEHEEFRGNVAFVPTREFYRPAEESPAGQGYHWNSNAETYFLIGEGMGKAMLGLTAEK